MEEQSKKSIFFEECLIAAPLIGGLALIGVGLVEGLAGFATNNPQELFIGLGSGLLGSMGVFHFVETLGD